MQELARQLIDATNAFDVERALALFAPGAVIDDVSVGGKFSGIAGVRRYLEQFFVGYNTSSKILSVDETGEHSVRIRLDFTGDFGHEVGFLIVLLTPEGLIASIDADLE